MMKILSFRTIRRVTSSFAVGNILVGTQKVEDQVGGTTFDFHSVIAFVARVQAAIAKLRVIEFVQEAGKEMERKRIELEAAGFIGDAGSRKSNEGSLVHSVSKHDKRYRWHVIETESGGSEAFWKEDVARVDSVGMEMVAPKQTKEAELYVRVLFLKNLTKRARITYGQLITIQAQSDTTGAEGKQTEANPLRACA